MKFSLRNSTVALTLIALTAIIMQLSAQNGGRDANRQPRYKLVDLGTLGGPQSWTYGESTRSLSKNGIVGGLADTAVLNSNPNQNPYTIFGDAYLHHGFRWKDGVKTDLGALPGSNSSSVFWIDDRGLAVGGSLNGITDPLTGWNEEHAVLWKDDQIIDLGTLGGNESQADSINGRGQIIGFAANSVPDSLPSPLGAPGFGTQQRAFMWHEGMMHDLGTLGGPDSIALLLNEGGQVSGWSYVDSNNNATTGIPTIDSFIWSNGTMVDLGNFGGTITYIQWLSQHGEIVGQSNLAGDQIFHPYLWSKGVLTDLGTLGGDFGNALWVNEKGVVVGWANNQNNQGLFAFVWKDGVMSDLGALGTDPCSIAWANNDRGDIVGSSSAECNFAGNKFDEHAFLWRNGKMYDLNDLVLPSGNLTLVEPHYINERGEITGNGVLPSGDLHAFLLTPCDEDSEQAISAAGPAALTPSTPPASSIGDSPSHPTIAQPITMTVKGRFGKPYILPLPTSTPTN
jgi:probable HAF family extracellular repeat protein